MLRKRVTIGNHAYKILEANTQRMDRMVKDSYGIADFGTLTIYLKNTLAETKKEQVLAHEIIHCLLEESGAHNFIREEDLEPFCETLENVFWNFLKKGTYFYE